MKSIFTVFIILWVTNYCYSQENKHHLKGIVKNDSIDVSNIKVLNKTSKQVTGTNNVGAFEIPVKLGDSLLISAIHIEEILLLITQDVLKQEEIEVNLHQKVNNMEVVVLNNLIAESALNFNAGPTTNPDPISFRRDEIKRLSETDPTQMNNTGVDIIGGISYIYKLLTKNRISKRQRLLNWEHFKVSFKNEFGDSFFINDLKISEEKIDSFLNFCKKKKDIESMYSKNEKLDLIDFLVKKSKEYKQKTAQ